MAFKERKNGFTMIEVVLVIILVAVLAGLTGNIMMQGADSYSLEYYRRDLMYQAKLAISRMEREIRIINSATPADIPVFTATDIEFIDINGNTIRFTQSGANIIRTLNGVPNTLCKDVGSLTFSYLKKDGTVAATAAEIWTISIELTVTGNESISFRTCVFLRGVHGQYSGWREV